MKTVIIYDQCEANLIFFVVEEDVSHLDGVYINQWIESDKKAERKKREALQDLLSKLVYDETSGKMLLEPLKKFPTKEVVAGAKVIVAGFLP